MAKETDIRKETMKLYGDYISGGKVKFYNRYRFMLIPDKREGSYLYDINGKRYLNCHCNGGVFNLGHRNREIIDVVRKAMDNYDIGNHHLVSRPKALLGKKFAEILPGSINHAILGVSGGEAIDTAIKFARAATGRNEVISAYGGYHGHTGFALSTGDDRFKAPFGKLMPGFKQVPFNDIPALKSTINTDTAAVIFETIPATAGMKLPMPDFFQEVRKLCNENGSIMIIDEVQTGLGRTGKIWAIENFNTVPDIIVTGKGLSGGIYPITATCVNEKIYDFVLKNPFIHVSTFGGSDIGCFAALKVLEIVSSKNFLEEVQKKGERIRNGLEEIKADFKDHFVEVRQLGMFMGLRFISPNFTLVLSKALFDNGLYAIYSANDKSVLQFIPPLTITESEIDEMLSILKKSLKMVTKGIKYPFVKFLIDHFSSDPV